MRNNSAAKQRLFELAEKGVDPIFKRKRFEKPRRAKQGQVIDALIAVGGQTDSTALRFRACYQSSRASCWSFGCPFCADRWAARLTRDAVRTSVLTSKGHKSFGIVATLASARFNSSAGHLDGAPFIAQKEFARAITAMDVEEHPVLVVPRLSYYEPGFRSVVGPHFRSRPTFIIFGYSASEGFVDRLKAKVLRNFDLSRDVDAALKIEPVINPARQFAELFGNLVPRTVTLLDNNLREHALTRGLDQPRVAEVARWADSCLGPHRFGSHLINWHGRRFLPDAQAVKYHLRHHTFARPTTALLK